MTDTQGYCKCCTCFRFLATELSQILDKVGRGMKPTRLEERTPAISALSSSSPLTLSADWFLNCKHLVNEVIAFEPVFPSVAFSFLKTFFLSIHLLTCSPTWELLSSSTAATEQDDRCTLTQTPSSGLSDESSWEKSECCSFSFSADMSAACQSHICQSSG